MPHSAITETATSVARGSASVDPPETGRVFNVTFHGVGDPDTGASIDPAEKRYWLSVDAFERVLERVGQWSNTQITFDDGNLSDLKWALPGLVKRQLRGSFFIVASRVGQPGYLGRAELLELLAAGMHIGSHGMYHQSWRRARGNDLLQEIRTAKSILEDAVGSAITRAGCPFGEYDRTALHLLASSGFDRVYTSDRGWARRDAWIQPRNTITAATNIDQLQGVRAWSWPRQLAHQLKLTLKRCR